MSELNTLNTPCICCGESDHCGCMFEDEEATIILPCPCGCGKCESCGLPDDGEDITDECNEIEQ